jgi:hypothetical protein
MGVLGKILGSIISILLIFGIFKGIAMWMVWSAEVNVKIRPEILELNWIEAMVSGHFSDWWITVNKPLFGLIGFMVFGVLSIIVLVGIWK